MGNHETNRHKATDTASHVLHVNICCFFSLFSHSQLYFLLLFPTVIIFLKVLKTLCVFPEAAAMCEWRSDVRLLLLSVMMMLSVSGKHAALHWQEGFTQQAHYRILLLYLCDACRITFRNDVARAIKSKHFVNKTAVFAIFLISKA